MSTPNDRTPPACLRVADAAPVVIEAAYHHWCTLEGATSLEELLEAGMAEVRRCLAELPAGAPPITAEALGHRVRRAFAHLDAAA